MNTNPGTAVPSSIRNGPPAPAREGFWTRIERLCSRFILDDRTGSQLPQPADYDLALPWSEAFTSAEVARWRRRAGMLTARGCLRLVVAVVCLVAGGVDVSHGRVLLGLAELWAGVVQLVVCWVPLIHAAGVRQELPRLALHSRSVLGVMLDDAATQPRRPSPAEIIDWDLAHDECLWDVLEASTAEQGDQVRRTRTSTKEPRVPVAVAVTTDRVICRTEDRCWSVPWSRVDCVSTYPGARTTRVIVWYANGTDDLGLCRFSVPSARTAHVLSRVNLACATAAGAPGAYLERLTAAGVPYRVRGPASSW